MNPVQQLDASTFPAFVADLWEHQGWRTSIRDVDGTSYVAAVRPEAGERGLIWAKSGSTGARVTGSSVVAFAKFCRENGVDDAAILTLGAFTDDAETAAEKFGVELLDGDGLATAVERHDLADLVAEHATGDDSGGSPEADGRFAAISGILAGVGPTIPDLEGLPSPSELVAPLRERLGEREVEVPQQIGVATVVVVALVVAGVVVGPSFVPSVGSLDPFGSSGTDEVPPVDVSAGPVQPDGAATTLYVEYDAVASATIDADPADDRVHAAPDGTRFVVVRLAITNTGGQPIDLRPALFILATDETVYRYQPLAGVTGFNGTTLSPDASYEGWTVFVVPENASMATLDVDQDAVRGDVAVQFAPNPNLTTNVTA